MCTLVNEICLFLSGNGFECMEQVHAGHTIITIGMQNRCVIPYLISSRSPEEAKQSAADIEQLVSDLSRQGISPVVITEDRWYRQNGMMKSRLLAHLEKFTPVFARNCQVRKIEKEEASKFLDAYHSYGDATCRYRYGMFLKKSPETLVAVATFSNARKWQKGDKVIRSYEWTRYASLPDVRISGGLGKMLKAFIQDQKPDDIMSYADLEWSEGRVYEQLGFVLEGKKEHVLFVVDEQWKRTPVGKEAQMAQNAVLFFQNFGSNKYRLKLTEYE